MDKLLLSLSFIALLMPLTVNSAPMPSSKLVAAIDQRHKKFTQASPPDAVGDSMDEAAVNVGSAESVRMQKSNNRVNEETSNDGDDEADDIDQRRGEAFIRRRDDTLGEAGLRRNKMISFFPYGAVPLPLAYAPTPYAAPPTFYPPEFYNDFEQFFGGYGGYGDEEEEIMSRMSPNGRRRPSNGNFKNSPIYYIRLPPTPYMFVPGLGYISQPPTYNTMAPIPQPISPFYNLPLDFISNGKPTNIYQWASPPATQFQPQPQYVPQQPQFGGYPSYHQPQRPQRPYGQRPSQNPYIQESKVTNLKGPYLFNGRPEEIFLLRNSYGPSYNPIYSNSRFSNEYY